MWFFGLFLDLKFTYKITKLVEGLSLNIRDVVSRRSVGRMNNFLEICKDIGFQNEGEKGMEIILKRECFNRRERSEGRWEWSVLKENIIWTYEITGSNCNILSKQLFPD